jgi:hypothetical protein
MVYNLLLSWSPRLLWPWDLFSHLASAMALDVAETLPLALEIRRQHPNRHTPTVAKTDLGSRNRVPLLGFWIRISGLSGFDAIPDCIDRIPRKPFIESRSIALPIRRRIELSLVESLGLCDWLLESIRRH